MRLIVIAAPGAEKDQEHEAAANGEAEEDHQDDSAPAGGGQPHPGRGEPHGHDHREYSGYEEHRPDHDVGRFHVGSSGPETPRRSACSALPAVGSLRAA